MKNKNHWKEVLFLSAIFVSITFLVINLNNVTKNIESDIFDTPSDEFSNLGDTL